MTSKECGNFITELRKENKLTQKELAEKINVTDMDAYAKELGSAVIFMCIPAFINGFMTLFVHIKIVSVISAVLFFTGIIICVIHIFKVQTKYNGSLL